MNHLEPEAFAAATNDAPAHAEYAVIGCLLNDPDAFNRIAGMGLAPESFGVPEMRAAFGVIQALLLAGKACDPVAAFEAATQQGKEVSLQALHDATCSIASSRSIRTHVEAVLGASLERRIRAAAMEALDLVRQPGAPREKLDRAQALFASIQAAGGKSAPRPVGEVVLDCLQRWQDMSEGRVKPGLPTRIPEFDRLLNGGLRTGRLNILAARPSVGKSAFALQLAITAAQQGWPALFLSQEMPADEVAERAAAYVARASYTQLQTGRIEQATWGRISEGIERLAKLPLQIDDQSGMTLLDIRAKAMSLARSGLKLLVLDYLQLSSGTRRDGNRNLEIGEISRGLKSLAKELDICVIALSQLSRKVEERAGKRPNMGDLRDSGEIEADADGIWFLWRPDDRPWHVGLGVDKNRQGTRGEMPLRFEGDLQRWGESTESLNRLGSPSRRGAEESFE